MKITRKLRHLWHDLYYAIANDKMEHFAMNCREAAKILDEGKKIGFRYYLHISLCQACANYFAFTQSLKQKMQSLLTQKTSQNEIDKLNEKMLEKFKK